LSYSKSRTVWWSLAYIVIGECWPDEWHLLLLQEELDDRQKQGAQDKPQVFSALHPSEPQKKPQYSSSESSDEEEEEEDIRDLEGRTYTKMGQEVRI
jgi:hypothetical protein